MDRFTSLISFLGSILFLSACAHPVKPVPRDIASLNEAGKVAGIWVLQGTSSTRGPYNGELELRPSHDGTFDVVRVVTYINYFYDGLRVQEVWTGKAVPDTDTLTLSYDLRQGEYITKLGETSKSARDLQTPLTVTMRFLPTPAGLAAQFSDMKVSEYSEWLTTSRPLDAQPLWKGESLTISAQGKTIPATERKKVREAQKILNFTKDPFIQNYKNKPQFKNELPEIFVEGVDQGFYRSNKDTIRLVNKITDDATIMEAVLRQNAYMPSPKEKALRYDDFIEKRNFSPANLVVVRNVVQNNLNIFSEDPDAAFTTGMYLASQAMRFKVTQEMQSMQNMKRALIGLRGLTEISKGQTEIASVIAPASQDLPEGWIQGTGGYQKFIWTPGNQKQSLIGMLHGLTWATIVTPRSESDVWMNLHEILKELNKKDLSVLSENLRATLEGLNAIVLEDGSAQIRFSNMRASQKGFYWAGNADWAREFESLLEVVNNIQLATALNNISAVKDWKKYLADEGQVYGPAQRPLRILANYGFGGTKDDGNTLSGSVKEALRALSEVPYPRPRLDVRIDHSGDPAWVASPIPRNYWTVTAKNSKSVVSYYQGLQQISIYKLPAVTSRFIWKEDAFQYQGKGAGDIEATGVDYVYAYWLARFCGVSSLQ